MGIDNGYLVPSAEATIRDYKHASKLFRDGNFRFLPKQEHLFHVAMNFANGIGFGESVSAERIQAGLLVKSVDLPSYRIRNDINNAYNRKNLIQTKIEYDPIKIAFHDDAANLTNAMWQAYYEHYYADSYGEEVEYRVPAKYGERPRLNYGYVPPRVPFFNSITIYSLMEQKFTGYTLVNPLIESWSHGKHDVSSDGELTNTMGIIFETVLYSHGIVGEDDEPRFFTDTNYDTEVSPLGRSDLAGPPTSVESTATEIRLNQDNIFDKFLDGNWQGGVAGLIDGALSGRDIGGALTNVARNVGGDVVAGNDLSRYGFPAGVNNELGAVSDILKPARAVRVATGQAPASTGDVATSNNSSLRRLFGG